MFSIWVFFLDGGQPVEEGRLASLVGDLLSKTKRNGLVSFPGCGCGSQGLR